MTSATPSRELPLGRPLAFGDLNVSAQLRSDLPSPGLIEQQLQQRQFDVLQDPSGYAAPRLAHWVQRLKGSGFGRFGIGSGGSMASGHYDGFKEGAHSHNPSCPFTRIIGFDGRIYLPADLDPHDPKIIGAISEATGLTPPAADSRQFWHRFGKEVPVTRMFSYEEIKEGSAKGCGFEYDICVLRRGDWIEIADYWQFVFQRNEVQWQKEVRTSLRARGVPSSECLNALKQLQEQECCWRIVATYALAQWQRRVGNTELQLPSFKQSFPHQNLNSTPGHLPEPFESPGAILAPLAEAWLEGKRGVEGLDRPSGKMPVEALEIVLAFSPRLLRKPPQPDWVVTGSALQRIFQDRAKAN